jgi:hypothetical protein
MHAVMPAAIRPGGLKNPLRHLAAASLSVAVLAGCLAGCGGSTARTCVTVPGSPPSNRILVSGTKLVVPVGATVFAAMDEPEYSVPTPNSFPYRPAESSNRAVATPERACPPKPNEASSLPVMGYVFRASHVGAATLTATIRRSWRSVPHAPQSFHATVIVRQR